MAKNKSKTKTETILNIWYFQLWGTWYWQWCL